MKGVHSSLSISVSQSLLTFKKILTVFNGDGRRGATMESDGDKQMMIDDGGRWVTLTKNGNGR